MTRDQRLFLGALFPAEENFIQYRKGSNDDDPDHDHLQVFLQVKVEVDQNKFLQIMAAEKHEEYPGRAADNIIGHKLFAIHGHDPGDDGGKGPHNGQKKCEDNGLPAMLVIELLCLVEVPYLEEEGVLAVEEKGAALFTEPVAQGIPKDTAKRDQDK